MHRLRFAFAVALALGAAAAACATSASDDTTDSGVPDSGPKDGAPSCGSMPVCGGKCADVTKDPNNCGGCGKKCGANQFCASSKCSDACNAPLKLCGQFCVDVNADHDNCGMCGKGCAADQDCITGSCIKHCTGGLTPCDNQCVNLTTDHENCGSCSTACGQSEVCTGGLCCAAGLAACQGQCVDLAFSNDNCGQCGFACGAPNPYCVGGKCTGCNPTVLLLMDSSSSDNQKLATDLNAAGLPTTLVSSGAQSYAGSPAASQFGAILVSGGSYPSGDMGSAGQSAIVSAQQAGVGVVLVEPLQLSVIYDSYFGTLSQIFLEKGSTDAYAYDFSVYPTLVKTQNHAIWNGITSPMSTTAIDYLQGANGQLANGATSLGHCAVTGSGTDSNLCSGDGNVLVKSGTGGRIVHFNVSITDSSYSWGNNADIRKMLVNALGWATTCK